jgi:hypothetical protein
MGLIHADDGQKRGGVHPPGRIPPGLCAIRGSVLHFRSRPPPGVACVRSTCSVCCHPTLRSARLPVCATPRLRVVVFPQFCERGEWRTREERGERGKTDGE